LPNVVLTNHFSIEKLSHKKKAGHKPDSVRPKALPIIYLDHWLPKGSNRLPFSSSVQPSNTDLHGVSPHRVYLVSLQHYLYILSVALVRPAMSGRRVLPAMLHYGVRTFLPDGNRQVDKVTCSLQIYFNC
jgi:hypothetical protein